MQFSPASIAAAAILLSFQMSASLLRVCSAQTTPSVPLQRPFVEAAKDALLTFSSADFIQEPKSKAKSATIQQFELQSFQLDESASSLRAAIINYANARVQNAALLLQANQAAATVPLSFKKDKYPTSVYLGGAGPVRNLVQSIDAREEACRLAIADSLREGQVRSDFSECELASVDPRRDPLPIPSRAFVTQSAAARRSSGRPDLVFELRAQVGLRSVENLQSSFIGSIGNGGLLGRLLSESRIDLTVTVARGDVERSAAHGLEQLLHLREVQLETQIDAERLLLAKLLQAPNGEASNDKLLAEVSQQLPANSRYAVATARYQSCRDGIREALSHELKLAQESCSIAAR